MQVPSAGKLYYCAGTGTPGGFVTSGSSLLLPRAAADTRGQYSTLHYTGASIVRYAMQGQQRGAQEQERRREGGTRERGKGRRRRKSLGLLVVRQQEIGSNLGDRRARWKRACYGGRM
jgi:hypothetical protein